MLGAQNDGRAGDGRAETHAKENQAPEGRPLLRAKLIDDLIEVVAFKKTAGGIAALALPVGAQIESQDVESQGMKGGGPGDSADFGVGVAVQENRAAAL